MLELHYVVANEKPVNDVDKINNIKVWIKYFYPGASEEVNFNFCRIRCDY
jgi:hypothetical protein